MNRSCVQYVFFNLKKRAGSRTRPGCGGKDLNLQPLGYECDLMMASPFVSKHLMSIGIDCGGVRRVRDWQALSIEEVAEVIPTLD